MMPSKEPVGLGCLGSRYMFAHDFYKDMGDNFFLIATQHGQTGILPAVKKAYTIAAMNLKQVIDVCMEPERKQ